MSTGADFPQIGNTWAAAGEGYSYWCYRILHNIVIVVIWKSLYVIWINLPLRGEIKAFWTECKRPYGTRYYAKLIRTLQTFRWNRHRKDSRHTAVSKHCNSFPLFAPSTHSRFTVLFGAFASCSSLRFSVAFFTVKKTGIYSNSAK